MKYFRFKTRLFFVIPYMFFRFLLPANRIIKENKKTDQEMYDFSYKIVDFLRWLFSTKTDYTGLENLPSDGGFIMYANHQGKYDALGIILAIKKPFSILWDIRSAKQPITKQISKMMKCEVIDTSKKQNFIPSMQRIAENVKNGRPYLIFPEGGYTDNKNNLQEFQTGCFMTSVLSKSTVVPVVLYDSYKAMDGNKLFGKARTQVHFLEPITYQEYEAAGRKGLATIVKERMQQKLDEIEAGLN